MRIFATYGVCAVVAATMNVLVFADPMDRSPMPGTVLWRSYGGYGQDSCPTGNDIVAVSAGFNHCLAQRSDGTLVAWGANEAGQLNCPAGSNYVAISSGSQFSIALRADGTIVGWGRYDMDQYNFPAGANYVAISAGGLHSLALRSDGSIVGCGRSLEGQLNCPAGTNFIAVSAGHVYSVALRDDGTLVAWGDTTYNQTNCPAGSNYVAISAGVEHSLALRADGTLVGWGGNIYGECNCPDGSNYIAIAGGWHFSLALRNDGTMTGWGDNSEGQIAYPPGNNYAAFAAGSLGSLALQANPFVDITNPAFFVDVTTLTCAIGGTNTPLTNALFRIVGDMWWTNTANGAAGSVQVSSLAFQVSDIPLAYGANTITVSGTNMFGLEAHDTIVVTRGRFEPGCPTSPGSLVGWGYNSDGQITCPVGIVYTAVAAGDSHSLALRSDGTIAAWGRGDFGQNISPAGSNFTAIAAGYDLSLALRNDGTFMGWGRNDFGQTNSPSGSNLVAIAAGTFFSLALRNDGTLICWGYPSDGVTNGLPGTNFTAIAAGFFHCLALRNDGTLTGWGNNAYGQTNCPPGSNYVAIAAGGNASLALRSDGTLAGWGDNGYGQTSCPPGSNYVAIAVGARHALALRNEGTVVGWGNNDSAQTDCPAGSNYVAIAAGHSHSLAVRIDPFADITNKTFSVDVSVAVCAIAGTNSPRANTMNHVVGTMWWTNMANGAHGSFAASQSWTISGIPLAYGENTIGVYGTNACGMLAQDHIVVTRGDIALVAPPDGCVTNRCALSLDAFYGPVIVHRHLMTNTSPVFDSAVPFDYTNQVSFPGAGTYYWTAMGYDAGFNQHYAPQTNQLVIVGPQVRLVSPPNATVLTNVLGCSLVADYGFADGGRQLSTNNGASWFDYDPLEAVVFPGAGTYSWTARGCKDGVWWHARESRSLVIATNYTGASLFLATPAQGSVFSSTNIPFSIVPCGPGFAFTAISIDGATFTAVSFPTSITVSPGMHTWTAAGWTWPGPVATYAPTTNTFTVIDPAASSVTLIAPADGAALEQDYLFFDVVFSAVNGAQLSTNNGADWFAYASPLKVPKGHFQWTARGTNSAGEWIYAAATNTVHLYDPVLSITTTTATVTFDVTSCAIAGAANAYVVGGLQWSNALNGASGQYSILNTQYSISNIPLGIGPNPITVIGTNAWGVPASDSVTITRGGIGTGMPFIDCDITNEPFIVYNAPTNIVFTGTNNLQVVGNMWIASSATTQAVVFAAAQSWTSLPVNIELYTNSVNVFGTNVFGAATNDVITVIGVPEPAVATAALFAISCLSFVVRRKIIRQVRSDRSDRSVR